MSKPASACAFLVQLGCQVLLPVQRHAGLQFAAQLQ